PGRKPASTRLVSSSRRGEVLDRIRAACREGQQAYWVCPVIEGAGAGVALQDGAGDLRAALDTYAALSGELSGLRVGLLHGRLPADEKAAVMTEFAAGRMQLLVATTVIEVGVDVPNAALMVIEHAERFGLAQLHQLRGRVGRGSAASVCVLLYTGPLSDEAKARMEVMVATEDGFLIAEKDLEIRGPGEFLGARQSGAPLLRFADLESDVALIEHA